MMCTTFVSRAQVLEDSTWLKNINHELSQQPWLTYQKLQNQSSRYENMTVDYKLWWLLRSAQTENRLFLSDQFHQTVNLAISLLKPSTSVELVSQLHYLSGIASYQQGKYHQAQALFQQAITLAEKHQLIYVEVLAKQELAYTRSLVDLYELSLHELQQAYLKAFSLSDDYLIAKINETYGAVYGYMDDFETSIEYYQKALVSYQHLGYLYDIAEATNGIAATYRHWKKYDLAIEYYYRYEQAIAFSPDNTHGKFYALYGRGMSQAEKGDCIDAIITINEAITLIGFIDYKAELYKRKAQCLLTQNRLAEVEEALTRANDIFLTLPELMETRWQIEIIKLQAELAQARGDSHKAYLLLKDFSQKERALLKKKSSDKLLRVRGALEHERQNMELSLLQQRTKVQHLQIEQQLQSNTSQNYLIALGTLLILMAIIWLFLQRRNNRRLASLTITDTLSELYSRGYVFKFLRKLIDKSAMNKSQVSIMAIDIDDFKSLNKRYGPPFGDYVIREIAKIGLETLRVNDVMGRIGGEEFLAVLPRIDGEHCVQVAQRFVDKVHAHPFLYPTEQASKANIAKNSSRKKAEPIAVSVSISIGIAVSSITITDANQLCTQADKALYQAKSQGKNRVALYKTSFFDSPQSHAGEPVFIQDV